MNARLIMAPIQTLALYFSQNAGHNVEMKRSRIQFLTSIVLLTATSALFAGSFQAWQQSGESVGNYAAGGAAVANDATTAFYNPAGLTRIKHQDAAISTVGKISSVEFHGRINPTPAITGYVNSGNIQGGTTRAIPTLLYAAPVSDKWGFGFIVTSPYETSIDYGRNSFARYAITKNKIYTIDLGPSIAYRVFNWLSIGAGFDAQYLRMTYNQADTTGANVTNDGLNSNVLTDWVFGWNFGALWEISQDTRFGISYRSRMDHRATGSSKYTGMRSRAKLHMELPPTTTFSLFHSFTDWFALMGTANFTHWRIMKNIVLTSAAGPGGTNNITMVQDLQNTWRFVLGATFKPGTLFTIRTGVGFDQSPIKNNSRNLIFTDSDKYLASLGFGYKISDKMSVDVGYTHAFFVHRRINQTQTYGAENLTTTGSIYSSEDTIGAQFNWLMT